jgi:hypothetical protein
MVTEAHGVCFNWKRVVCLGGWIWISRLLIDASRHTFIYDIILRGIISRICPYFNVTLLLLLGKVIVYRFWCNMLIWKFFSLLLLRLYRNLSGLPFIFVGVPPSFLGLFPRLLFNLVLIRYYLNFTWVIFNQRRLYGWYFGFKLFSFCIAISIQAPFSPLSNHFRSLLTF